MLGGDGTDGDGVDGDDKGRIEDSGATFDADMAASVFWADVRKIILVLCLFAGGVSIGLGVSDISFGTSGVSAKLLLDAIVDVVEVAGEIDEILYLGVDRDFHLGNYKTASGSNKSLSRRKILPKGELTCSSGQGRVMPVILSKHSL